jgi:hypothetical protein
MANPVLQPGHGPADYAGSAGAQPHGPFPMSLHGSVEAAIVVAFLFAFGWALCLANLAFTKYVGTRTLFAVDGIGHKRLSAFILFVY